MGGSERAGIVAIRTGRESCATIPQCKPVTPQLQSSALSRYRTKSPEWCLHPINDSQLQDIQQKIEDTVSSGAKVETGGEAEGRVIPPTVLSGVSMDMRAAKEELFGPVAPIISVNGEEEALRAANDTDLGLSSAVFTSDLERGVRFARRIEAGMTHVNDHPVNDEPNTAFGGEKLSGLGRFGGRWALEEFTTEHWVSVQHEPRAYPI